MAAFADETLMAYADGELVGSAADEVAAAIAADPALAERASAYIRTGRPLAALYAPILSDEVPQKLLDVLQTPNFANGKATRSPERMLARGIRDFWSRLFADASPLMTWSQGALACSLALGVGLAVGSGWPLGHSRSEGLVQLADGALQAGGAWSDSLETLASGQVGALSSTGGHLTPRLSFQTASKDFCRQYVLTMQDSSAFEGVACRKQDGAWIVRVHEPIAFARGASGTVPAAGAGSPVVEAVVDKLILGDVLGRDDEGKALAGHWTAAQPK